MQADASSKRASTGEPCCESGQTYTWFEHCYKIPINHSAGLSIILLCPHWRLLITYVHYFPIMSSTCHSFFTIIRSENRLSAPLNVYEQSIRTNNYRCEAYQLFVRNKACHIQKFGLGHKLPPSPYWYWGGVFNGAFKLEGPEFYRQSVQYSISVAPDDCTPFLRAGCDRAGIWQGSTGGDLHLVFCISPCIIKKADQTRAESYSSPGSMILPSLSFAFSMLNTVSRDATAIHTAE